MEKMSIEEICGNYALAVEATLDLLRLEQHKRDEEWRKAAPYRRNSIKRIEKGTIDRIMRYAFGPATRYMADIRRYYFNSEKGGKISPLKSSRWDFRVEQLINGCKDCQIDISEKINEIQRLVISTLTVAEVLSKDDSSITANIKDEVRKNINTACSGFEANYGTQYWKVTVKHLPKCANDPAVKDLMILLPQCNKKFIHNWLRQLEDFPSPLRRKERIAWEEFYSPLQDYSKELIALDKNQVTTPCVWEEVFYSLTIKEISCIISSYDFLFKAISEHKLRADDINLAYLVETQISDEYKEIFYDTLTDELKLDGNIAF